MFTIGAYYRGDRNVPITPYDSFPEVQFSLFSNLEQIGIDHETCVLALPGWGPGDQRNYAKNKLSLANTGVAFENDSLKYSEAQDRLETAFSFTAPHDMSVLTSVTPANDTNRMFVLNFQEDNGASSDVDYLYIDFNGTVVDDPVYYGWRSVTSANAGSVSSLGFLKNKENTTGFTITGSGSDLKVRGFLKNDNGYDYTSENNLASPTSDTTANPLKYLYTGCRRRNGTYDYQFLGSQDYLLAFDMLFSENNFLQISDNPWGIWQRVAPIRRFFPAAEAGGSTDLTATDITTGAPTLSSPSISQTHKLTASNITAGVPLIASPTLHTEYQLLSIGIVTQPPILETPTMSQIHELGAQDIDTLNPAVVTPNIGQEHVLSAQVITTGTPIVSIPSLSEGSHSLISTSITTDAPTVDTPTVGQIHVLSVTDIVTGDPMVDPATMGWVHALISSAILTGVPIFNAPVLTELAGPADNLTATDIATGTPDVDTPSIGQTHALTSILIVTGVSIVGIPALNFSILPTPQERTFTVPFENRTYTVV